MTLNRLPKKFRQAVMELTENEEFQKIYAEDKVLNEVCDRKDEAMKNYNELYAKADQRACQLVVDYILEHNDITVGFFRIKLTSEKLKKFLRKCLIESMRSEGDSLRYTIDEGEN